MPHLRELAMQIGRGVWHIGRPAQPFVGHRHTCPDCQRTRTCGCEGGESERCDACAQAQWTREVTPAELEEFCADVVESIARP